MLKTNQKTILPSIEIYTSRFHAKKLAFATKSCQILLLSEYAMASYTRIIGELPANTLYLRTKILFHK